MFAGAFFAQNQFGGFTLFRVKVIIKGANDIDVDFVQIQPSFQFVNTLPVVGMEEVSPALEITLNNPSQVVLPNATYSSHTVKYSDVNMKYSGSVGLKQTGNNAPVMELENPELAVSIKDSLVPEPKPARVKYSSSTTRYSDINTTYSGQ